MSEDVSCARAGLKEALLALNPTGHAGFEGLIAELLNEITKQDFRLAASGLQLGLDGETIAGRDHISFEGKLYREAINKNEVLSKITSIIGSPSPPDLWILGATIEAKTQLLDQIQSAAGKNGIAILILDWPAASRIPPLAAICAMALERACDFFAHHLTDPTLISNAMAAMKVIASDEAFEAASDAIKSQLNPASLGIPLSIKRNAAWLRETFGNSAKARMALGQRLAPFAKWPLPTQSRAAIVSILQGHLDAAPEGQIIALLGGEGVGKSWLAAQAWQASSAPPLTLIVPAADLNPESQTDFDDFLISKLIEQTQDRASDYTRTRWANRFNRWRVLPKPSAPRLVVCIDGLNQHSSFNWPRWLDGAASKLADLGGTIILTDRKVHFDGKIGNALTAELRRLEVPQWEPSELATMLADKGIEEATLQEDVLKSLRNPRVLGIAFELLERKSITSFDELSVGRLLFEHIRVSERDGSAPESAVEFSKRLADHAQEVLSRAEAQQRGDQLVFEIDGERRFELKPALLAVTAERYFHPLPDDPTLYQITDQSLSLAIGLSIIQRLKAAKRAGDDLSDTLARLLEPISALDKTADAMFNAAVVANVDDTCPPEIGAALQVSYVQLQNVGDETRAPFEAALRLRPEATMQAIALAVTAPGHVPRADWLIDAARSARSDSAGWAAISDHIKSWLSLYTLSPAMQVYSRRTDDPAKYESELMAGGERIETMLASLTDAERAFMAEHMRRDDNVNPAEFANIAFKILSGMPLADFGQSFVAWALSDAANGGLHGADDAFYALIRFNRSDWSATRDAILSQAAFLSGQSASKTGKWALVTLLRALATEDDAEREDALVGELTADRERFGPWRLVENYCATDPCDPASSEPSNIDQLAERFLALKVSDLSSHEGVTEHDHFFDDALPGLARFRPEAGLDTVRRLADDTARRTGRPLFLSLVELVPHSSALTASNIGTLTSVARTHAVPRQKDDPNEPWISSQYALNLAFPHISGDEQLAELRRLPPGNVVLLKLLETMKLASPEAVELALEEALNGHVEQKLALIVFARQQQQNLSQRSREIIGVLATDSDGGVRGEAVGLIASLNDKSLLEPIAASGWSATPPDDKENAFTTWHRSVALIRAAMQGLVSVSDAITRITPQTFSVAAYELGAEAGPDIAERLTVACERALGAKLGDRRPRAELEIPFRPSPYPPMFSLQDEPEVRDNSIQAQLGRMSETPEEFHRRQERAFKAFQRFEAELTQHQARLIIEDVGTQAIEAAISSSPGWGLSVASMLLNAPEDRLYRIGNFGLRLALALSAKEPEVSAKLFERLTSSGDSSVNIVYGPAAVPLQAFCVWGGAANAEWDALRSARLDNAASDQELAVEVLAALHCDKAAFVEQYAKGLLDCPEPVAIARALMALGLSAPSTFADETIGRFEKVGGFLGRAAHEARYAYERNVWSQHWYQLMGEANSNEEYWRYSVLLRKIVDGRFAIWERPDRTGRAAAALFDGSLDADIKRRIKKWVSKREKNLLGSKAPASIFLTPLEC